MGNFDPRVLVFSLYVALVYAMLAFGATAYRQVIDNLAVKDVDLGEDIHFAYDPMAIFWTGILYILSIIMTIFVVFVFPTAEVQFYVLPLMILINAIQFTVRLRHQRLHIKRYGLLGRNMFSEKFEAVHFEQLLSAEYSRSKYWSEISLYYTAEYEEEDSIDDEDSMLQKSLQKLPSDKEETLVFERDISTKMLDKLLFVLSKTTSIKIEERTKKKRSNIEYNE